MKSGFNDFLENNLLLFVALNPFLVILERTVRINSYLFIALTTGDPIGTELYFLLYLSIISIIAFLCIWFVINYTSKLDDYLSLISSSFCSIAMILWLLWELLLPLYILGVALICLSLIPRARESNSINGRPQKSRSKSFHDYLLVLSMSYSMGFLFSLYFWHNLFIYINMIAMVIITMLIIYNLIVPSERIPPKKDEDLNISKKPLSRYLKSTFLVGIGILVPFVLVIVFFLYFYGIIGIFSAIRLSYGKLWVAVLLAILTLILALAYKKET